MAVRFGALQNDCLQSSQIQCADDGDDIPSSGPTELKAVHLVTQNLKNPHTQLFISAQQKENC